MTSSTKTRLILVPAAGFGRRVGSPEAKELLPRPDGRLFIDQVLLDGLRLQIPVHVITRKEKASLIEYLENFKKQNDHLISIQLVESSKEWPDTLLQSEDQWYEENLVYLPDMEFSPDSAPGNLFDSLKDKDAGFATFAVDDPRKWGVIAQNENQFSLCEKPTIVKREMAWGLFSFRKNIGKNLLSAILESTFDHQWKSLNLKIAEVQLENYKDLSRGPS